MGIPFICWEAVFNHSRCGIKRREVKPCGPYVSTLIFQLWFIPSQVMPSIQSCISVDEMFLTDPYTTRELPSLNTFSHLGASSHGSITSVHGCDCGVTQNNTQTQQYPMSVVTNHKKEKVWSLDGIAANKHSKLNYSLLEHVYHSADGSWGSTFCITQVKCVFIDQLLPNVLA